MIEFRTLPDDHLNLMRSPLLRGALLALQYAQEHGSIGLTQTKAFKRVFVHWAVEHFDWPGKSAEEMFRCNKVINEYEFPPLEVLHFLLISLRLGRHYKGAFRLTKICVLHQRYINTALEKPDPHIFARPICLDPHPAAIKQSKTLICTLQKTYLIR